MKLAGSGAVNTLMRTVSLLAFLFLAVTNSASSANDNAQPVLQDGSSLKIEFKTPIERSKAQQISAWLHATAREVGKTYGRFPNPDVKIIVIPTANSGWGNNDAVIFGRVTRRGGETIEIFVNPERPIEEFYADWTATHELSHLMLPLLSKRYRWISEGFATYYQNVLMSRADQYTRQHAWQRLLDGFRRGEQSRPELSPNQAAAAGIRQARMKVYWSGAAIALLADIELRRRSGGRESLDTVLGELQACCLPSRRTWSGPQLFRKLDSFLDSPVFMPLYREHANSAGFPETSDVIDALGISRNRNVVRLTDDGDLAELRDEIL